MEGESAASRLSGRSRRSGRPGGRTSLDLGRFSGRRIETVRVRFQEAAPGFRESRRRFGTARRWRRANYPQRRVNFPWRRMDSPERRVNYPQRRIDSPWRRADYPWRRMDFPWRRVDSPQRRTDYPQRRVDSPERRVDYPWRRADYPQRRTSHRWRRRLATGSAGARPDYGLSNLRSWETCPELRISAKPSRMICPES